MISGLEKYQIYSCTAECLITQVRNSGANISDLFGSSQRIVDAFEGEETIDVNVVQAETLLEHVRFQMGKLLKDILR